MKKIFVLLLVSFLFAGFVMGCGNDSQTTPESSSAESSAESEEVEAEFVFSVHQNDPATSATGLMFETWAENIREASEGRIEFEMYHGGTLGSPADSYDLLSSGVADVAFINTAYFPGNFPLIEVCMLPMTGITNATQASKSVWDLYKKYESIQNDFSDFHVIAVHGNCSSPISTKDNKITEISQLSGMNIRGNSGPPTKFVENLGAAAVSVKITELFEAINNNTIDAVITDWHAIKSFALYEACNCYLDENIGITTFLIGMNKDSYNSLPDDLKAVVDECSGDALIEYIGDFWNDAEEEARNSAIEEGGEIYKLSDSERSKLQEVADKTVQDWIKSKEAEGYDNVSEIVDSFYELVEKYGSEN